MDNELRRTKIKLNLIDSNTEGLHWLLGDIVRTYTGNIKATHHISLKRLREEYKKYIKDNTPEDPKQQKLEL